MSKHVAGHKAKRAVHELGEKTQDMLQPLLDESSVSSDEQSDYSAKSSSSISALSVEYPKPTPTQWLKTAAVGLGLVIATAVSGVAMVVAQTGTMFVAAGICIAHVPYSAYKEYRIIKLPTLRSMNNQLKQEANKMEDEVDKLKNEIDDLQPEALRAAEVQDELRELAEEQHYNVSKFVSLVKENRSIQAEMQDNLRQRVVQDIIQIVVMSDKNNDGRFCKVETKMLVLKISLKLQEYGVEFDESKFYKVMSVDPTVAQTITIVKSLIPDLNKGEDGEDGNDSDDDDDDENKDAYDMFHMAGNPALPGVSMSMSLRSDRSTATSGTAKRMSLSLPKRPPEKKKKKKKKAREAPARPPVQEKEKSRRRDKLRGKRDRLFGKISSKSTSA